MDNLKRKKFNYMDSITLAYGKGGYCWDSNNKKYIDYTCGYGAIVLGHGNSDVNSAVINQLERGILLPTKTLLQEELNIILKDLFPNIGSCHFVKTGSEAVAAAIRLARAYTKKDKIIRCGFHGWHDPLVTPYISWHQLEIEENPPREVAGLPTSSTNPQVLTWFGKDIHDLEKLFQANPACIAALLIDPVQLRDPIADNLVKLHNMVNRYQALLILDEAKTGFRVTTSGVQGLYNIYADLTILSKAIANGFPLAVVIGRPDIMELSRSAKLKGTYNLELVSVAAAIKTISIIRNANVTGWLNTLGQQLIDNLNQLFERSNLSQDIQAVAYRWPCMPYLWFKAQSPNMEHIKQLFYEKLAYNGVLMLPNHMNYISFAHKREDIEETLEIMENVIKEIY